MPSPSHDWVRLDAERRWTRWLARVSPFDLGADGLEGFVIVVAAGIVWAIGMLVLGLTIPRPLVNVDDRQIRLDGRTFEFSEISLAGLSLSGGRAKRNVDLRLRMRRATLYIQLVVRGNVVLDASTRRLVNAMIEGSAIETSSARRARIKDGAISYGLTREDALAALRTPPTTDGDLPRTH